jgi:hypothetical protein
MQPKRFRFEIVGLVIMLTFGAAYYFDHRGEGTPTEKAIKAIEQVDTLRAVSDSLVADADSLKADLDSAKMDLREVKAQLNKAVDWIEKRDPSAAKEIEQAKDTVKPKEE